MRHKLISLILFVLIVPLGIAADDAVSNFSVAPAVLPGQSGYTWQLVREWLGVNLFTVSTKAKQEKKLNYADRRLAEILALLNKPLSRPADLDRAVRGYQQILPEAADMAEQIIFLDGAELPLAYTLEGRTETHEQALRAKLAQAGERVSFVRTALQTASAENQEIYLFIVTHYQFNQQDIARNSAIVANLISLLQTRLQAAKAGSISQKDLPFIREQLNEARKYLQAGLNVQAYNLVKAANDVLDFRPSS